MNDTLRILLGAVVTVLWCWAAGRLLLSRVYRGLSRVEENLLAIPIGAACVSLFVFGLCLAGLARKGVFQWSAVFTAGVAIWYGRGRTWKTQLPRFERVGVWIFIFIFTCFFGLYFLHALAPEVSPDGAGYHLGNVHRMWREQGFVWDHHNMYSYLSQGMEMLFLVAFAFGKHSAAAMVHVAFQAVLPLLLMAFGLRTGHARAGVFAAVAVYASPVVGLDGSVAYNDVGLAAVLLTIVYLLQIWLEDRGPELLFLIGLMSGFAFGIKYTAAVVVALIGVYVVRAWWQSRVSVAGLGVLAAGVVLTAGPWVLRNWIWLGNPVAPFFNAWFPNPYYHPGMEQIYREGLARYEGIAHAWLIPWELTVRGGGNVGGMLGPVFLLAPLGLLALRRREGRLLLAAAAILAIPATQNTGARFLIPSLPFLAMAMGIALERIPLAMVALGVAHAVLCWPALLAVYCHPYAWRLGSPNLEASFRRIPENEWLIRHSPEIALAPRIEAEVGPGKKLFSFAGRPEAYFNREIVMSYQSTGANLMNDILLAPIDGYKPTAHRRFSFAARPLEAIRVTQSAGSTRFWTVTEMRVYLADREIGRGAGWRVSARPNGREVQLAFDNSPVTRWSSWEAARPGQYVELRFERPAALDRVVVESAGEGHSKLRLEGRGAGGGWQVLAAAPEIAEAPPPRGMRLAAARELKARGVAHLLIQDTDFFFADASKHLPYWGMVEVAYSGASHLYRIE